MKMKLIITNESMAEDAFQCFGNMLKMAYSDADILEKCIVIRNVDADSTWSLQWDKTEMAVSAETYFCKTIQHIYNKFRCMARIGKSPVSYHMDIIYMDIRPELFCSKMQTEMEVGYPYCEQAFCPKRTGCQYANYAIHVVCRRCGNTVRVSDNPEYTYQCDFCDEDLYSFETGELYVMYSKNGGSK